ncbi:hypothetical protein BKP35_18675 [Anaerobacillus arseniciselenatis]|uniref:Homoserine dehydrogenase n=1 Tax=Anaerobacillus arseniciselenatis TaxID=85682 RepID=A0A1S2L6T9_9BACI|nr:homoserine dehydrogenase [Anaerobacillus arseniciselenatis]OIJ07703.1 hypothetical protein BKP35_18675 [Anaerobacillus arseniciselenatis]
MIKVGFLGFGTVNSGVYEGIVDSVHYLEQILQEEICIQKILVRNKAQYLIGKQKEVVTDSPEQFFAEPFDVVFEAMGGEQPALEYISFLLTKKIPVVTANKELIAKHGQLLESIANENGTFIGYEATVAGGIPIINTLRSQLQWTAVNKVSGILNGTTNYIISKLKNGDRTFSSVLKEAQQLGFAEADPTADIEGYDALYKLQILCKLCFGVWVNEDAFIRNGMSQIESWNFNVGATLGLKLKYIAEAYYDGHKVQGNITPCYVEKKHPLAAIEDENNGVYIQGDWLGNFLTSGPGAGKKPTATSMIEDYLHQIQKKAKFQEVNKRWKVNSSTNKEFIVLYSEKNEEEVFEKLNEVTYNIGNKVYSDNSEKIALLIIGGREVFSLFSEQEEVQIIPVLRMIESISDIKSNEIEQQIV